MIDWNKIASEAFDDKFSAKDLVFEFAQLPISESLTLNFESNLPRKAVEKHLNQRNLNSTDMVNQFKDEFAQEPRMNPSVFMDASNPLLSQVAIFARLLEILERGHLD